MAGKVCVNARALVSRGGGQMAGGCLMTQIHWTNPISDVFSNGADWSGGVVPGASDDAILDASGGAFTVTSSVSETVSSIQTAANATLAITGGAFTATGGTGAGVNAGLTSVVNGGTFSVGGVIDNAGTIEALGQIGQTSPEIAIGIGGGALSGGGTIALAAATGTGGNTGTRSCTARRKPA